MRESYVLVLLSNVIVHLFTHPLLPSLLQFYIMSMSLFGLGMVVWFFFRCVQQNFDGKYHPLTPTIQ